MLVGLALVLVLATVGGGVLLRPDDGEVPAVATADPAASVDRSALRTVRLEPEDLEGSWTLDADLERQARAVVPAMLCTSTEFGAPLETVAYRAGSPGPRVAQALRAFPAGEAEAFMAALDDEVACLERLGGVEDVQAERLDRGDGALRISYTRPGSALVLDVDLVFQRVGDVVSQVIHLDYPSADEALTDALLDATDAKLAALSG